MSSPVLAKLLERARQQPQGFTIFNPGLELIQINQLLGSQGLIAEKVLIQGQRPGFFILPKKQWTVAPMGSQWTNEEIEQLQAAGFFMETDIKLVNFAQRLYRKVVFKEKILEEHFQIYKEYRNDPIPLVMFIVSLRIENDHTHVDTFLSLEKALEKINSL